MRAASTPRHGQDRASSSPHASSSFSWPRRTRRGRRLDPQREHPTAFEHAFNRRVGFNAFQFHNNAAPACADRSEAR
jgi:hypothetical protein